MQTKQQELSLIKHEVPNGIVPQRASDGYVNATEMCRAADKKFNDYHRNKTSESFLAELSLDTGIPVSKLVVIIKGGNRYVQGTWVHPQVAINLAQWCSAKFAVAVAKLVTDWMRGDFVTVMPYHLE